MEFLSSYLASAGGVIIASLLISQAKDISKNLKLINELMKKLGHKKNLEHTLKVSVKFVDIVIDISLPKNSYLKKITLYANSSLVAALFGLTDAYRGKSDKKKEKETTIVGMILGNKIKSSSISYSILFGALLVHLIFLKFSFNEVNGFFIFIVSIGMLLTYLDQKLIILRINKGWYGRNEYEAREIIDYIINHSNKDDFTDGDGLKKVLPNAQMEELKKECTRLSGIGATQ